MNKNIIVMLLMLVALSLNMTRYVQGCMYDKHMALRYYQINYTLGKYIDTHYNRDTLYNKAWHKTLHIQIDDDYCN